MEKLLADRKAFKVALTVDMNLLKQRLESLFFAAEQKRNDYRYTFYLGSIHEWCDSWF